MKSQNLIDKSSAQKKSDAWQQRRRAQQNLHDVPSRPYDGLENANWLAGDLASAAECATVIQREGLLHRRNESRRVQTFLTLQRLYGNQFVQRVIAQHAIQAKLKIGQPGDIHEQEADRLAEQVMKMAEPPVQRQPQDEEEREEGEEFLYTKPVAEQITPLVQRQPEEEEKEEEEELQMKASPGQTPQVTPDLESRINAMKGGGQPLPKSARAFFETRFGHDFSQVRVHTDAQAAETARTVNARAFTRGGDLVFGTGHYAPETAAGKRLLAHELTHVIQQKNSVPLVQRQKGMTAKGKTIFRKTKYKTYRLGAKTLKEAVEEMKKTHGDEGGECEWFPNLTYSYDEKGTITDAQVDVKTEITLPKWPGAKNAKKAARAEWNRFRKALKKHEQGHADLVREKLKGVAESLVGKSTEDAEKAYQKALDDLKKASEAYDVETDHGRNQGTIIDLSKEQ